MGVRNRLSVCVPLYFLVYLVPFSSFKPFIHDRNDVIANSDARERLGVIKMADSESSTPTHSQCSIDVGDTVSKRKWHYGA
jgi:hypothetical protein